MSFSELSLRPEILQALQDKGYETPTPIQSQAIPLVLQGRDLVGLAQTGTGKTAGFILPMLQILSGGRAKMRMPRSLVLAPTRELAAQVADNCEAYSKYLKISHALIVGGESMGDQMKILDRGVDVLIATPGRLLDIFDRGKILLTDIKILVIDEADRMLDMGFIPDIEKICMRLPARRQTLLFSATMPPEIKKLTDRFLQFPETISVSPPSTAAATVDHRLMSVPQTRKKEALARILRRVEVANAFVFCNRKRDVADLGRYLKSLNFPADTLHGDMAQPQRTAVLEEFRKGTIKFLICSDVAARGLDIKGVSHVINFDVPFNPEDYVHRIGRTGRAGETGQAFTFVTEDDVKLVDAIEKILGQTISKDKSASMPVDKNTPPKTEQPKRRPHDAQRGVSAPGQGQPTGKTGMRRPDAEGFTEDDVPAFLRR